MAKHTQTIITSDLSGAGAAHEINFSVDGVDYTIDLTEAERGQMEEVLRPYTNAANIVGKQRRAASAGRQTKNRAIRTWAEEQGFPLGKRGRIPREIIDAYENRHQNA